MSSIKKLNKEFNELKEPEDFFVFEFNKDNDDHIRLCKFVSQKLRGFSLNKDYELKSYCSNERVCKLTDAFHIKNKGVGKK